MSRGRFATTAVLALGLAGCASASPPELNFREVDADAAACRQGRGPAAIAACQLVLARPDPVHWPGFSGTALGSLVYRMRAEAALSLAGHLASAGRRADAREACGRAVLLLRRHDEVWGKPHNDPALLALATIARGCVESGEIKA